MVSIRWVRALVLGAAVFSLGCAETEANEEAKSADSVAGNRSAMEELEAIPKELRAEVDKITQPIDEIDKVIEQLTSLPSRVGVSAGALGAMVRGVLDGGPAKLQVEGGLDDEAKAEVGQVIGKLKAAVAGLKAAPERIGGLAKMLGAKAARVPILAGKVGAEAATTIANPFADDAAKAKAQADTQKVKKVADDVMKVVSDTQAKIAGLPGRVTGALQKLGAAFAGDGGGGEAVARGAKPGKDKADAAGAKGGGATRGGGAAGAERRAVVRVTGGLDREVDGLRRELESTLAARGFAVVPDDSVEEVLRGRRGADAQLVEQARAALGADAAVLLAKGTSLGGGRKAVVVTVSGPTGGAKASPRVVQARPDELAKQVPAAVAELLGGQDAAARPAPAAAAANTPPRGKEPVIGEELDTPSAAAAGGARDSVLLKDGATVRGRVIDHKPGSFVTIETAEGAQRTIAWDRVGEVVVVPAKKRR